MPKYMHHHAAMRRLLRYYCWTRSKKAAQRTTNLIGTGCKQNTTNAQAARLIESDDEDAIPSRTANQAAQVKESECKSVSKRDQKLTTD